MLWNIAKVSRSLQAYLDAEYFAFNILSAQQQDISTRFAESDTDLFHDVAFQNSPRGVPLIDATLVSFECRTDVIHDCGDHHIIIGEVVDYTIAEGEPLIFHSGRYAKLE